MRLRNYLLIGLGSASLLCTWRTLTPPLERTPAVVAGAGESPSLRERGPLNRDRIEADLTPARPSHAGPTQEPGARVFAAIAGALATVGVRDRPELEHEIAAQLAALVAGGDVDFAQEALAKWARGPHAMYLGSAPIKVVSEALARNSPIAAVAWLCALPESRGRGAALERVVADWALVEPHVALGCARAFTDEDTRRRAMVQAIEPWLARDPLDATRWLAEHESDPLVDRVIADVIAGSFGQSDPELASHWAQVIVDPELRERAAEYVETHRRFAAVGHQSSLDD